MKRLIPILLAIVLLLSITLTGCNPQTPEAPEAPTGLNCTAVSISQIDLSWDVSTGADGYKIYRCEGTNCTPTTLVDTEPTTTWSDSGLNSSTTYCYSLKAYNDAGESDYSSIVSCCTGQCVIDSDCSADEWVDTGNIRWVSADPCTEKEQKEQEYRDYYCDAESDCQYAITDSRWVDTGATINKPDGTPCNDGDDCTVDDICSGGVCLGTPIDCGDEDDDGIPDDEDNCPEVYNPDQMDSDADGYGAMCDCDDGDDTIYPGAPEICGDGKDNDCDGVVDEEGATGCVTYYRDYDGDGWGTDDSKCLCAPDGEYTATLCGDCNDGDPDMHPGHPEVCDGKDNDCDTVVDEGCP